MISVTSMIHINAPVEKVFAYLADPNNLIEVWPSMQEVRNVQIMENGGAKNEWTYKMAGIRLEGSSETVEFIPNRRMEVLSRGGIESLITWIFEDAGGGTDLTVKTEYKLPIPVLGKLAEGFIVKQNEQESQLLLSNLKARMEVPEAAAQG